MSVTWIIALVALLALLLLARWQAYQQTLPTGLEFTPIDLPPRLPPEAQTALDQISQALIALGFTPLETTLVTAAQGKLPAQYSALFWHPEEQCYAQICCAPDRSARPQLTISSLLRPSWSLRTTTQGPSLLEALTPLERAAWSVHPSASTADLLARHQAQREQLQTRHQLEQQPGGSAAAYYIKAKEEALRRRQVLKRQLSVLSLVRSLGIRVRTPREWWG
jgi:hypothetical protein